MVNLAPEAFVAWLRDQLKTRGWTVREAARRAGISHTSISYILGGDQPSFDTCMALGRIFETPPIYVLTLSGLLPQGEADVTFEDWKFVLSQLSPRDRQELLEFAKVKLKLQEAERRVVERRGAPQVEPAGS